MHGGDRDTGVARPVGAQAGAGLRLVLVVELRLDAAQELVGELARADAARGFDAALEDPGRDGQDGAVTAHDVLHARPLDLDDRRMAVLQRRTVRLAHRGGGERLELELAERLLDRFAELLLEHRAQLVGRHARDVGMELGELVGDRRGKQVGAGRGDLAELHEHPAGALEDEPHPAREVGRVQRRRRPVAHVQQVLAARVADELAEAAERGQRRRARRGPGAASGGGARRAAAAGERRGRARSRSAASPARRRTPRPG